MARILQLAATLALACPPLHAQDTQSKTPPQGAPWTQDFFAARAEALRAGKPIFLYSTKTY